MSKSFPREDQRGDRLSSSKSDIILMGRYHIQAMIRTIVSFDPDDKRWLEQKAKDNCTTIAALVRKAVKRMRSQEEMHSPSFEALLEKTSGIRNGKDGLTYQQKMRDEWF
ncbi:MAG: hypothetical protein BRC47_06940 [Cyanobacteria bacterium QS_7_48_42]|nr:MAG: hypothetical protein BRC34_05935 [Cyanobacteria bacterium QH_1_48_107]PSP02829.1 MAG: hypothetical protein BRC47_06940 [Cyanobacteria bacterium QS_7_48_42]PSP35024.1 MAG: hypothetical protein BRC57_09480 [Cyanobacteria bacterium QS_8_48_54]